MLYFSHLLTKCGHCAASRGFKPSPIRLIVTFNHKQQFPRLRINELTPENHLVTCLVSIYLGTNKKKNVVVQNKA